MNAAPVLFPAKVVSIAPQNPISRILSWFRKAVPSPSDRNIHVQLGVHLEEVAEMLSALLEGAKDGQSREQLEFFHQILEFAQKRLKEPLGGLTLEPGYIDRQELLDALCDQIVTSVGIAHMFELDIENALLEVVASNDSKFGPDGEPIFNEQGKIMKGPNYFAPDLRPFV